MAGAVAAAVTQDGQGKLAGRTHAQAAPIGPIEIGLLSVAWAASTLRVKPGQASSASALSLTGIHLAQARAAHSDSSTWRADTP